MDIREIKISNPLDYAMRKIEEELKTDGNVNEEKYIQFLEIVKELDILEKSGKIKLDYLDNPKNNINPHTISFTLIQDAWEENEKEIFLSLLNTFDGIFFSGDVSGNISIMGITKDLYV